MSNVTVRNTLKEVIHDVDDDVSDADLLATTGELRRQLGSNQKLRARLPEKDRAIWDKLVSLLDEADEVLADPEAG